MCTAHCVSFTHSSAREDVGKLPPRLRLDHHIFDIITVSDSFIAQSNLVDFFQYTQATTGV